MRIQMKMCVRGKLDKEDKIAHIKEGKEREKEERIMYVEKSLNKEGEKWIRCNVG